MIECDFCGKAIEKSAPFTRCVVWTQRAKAFGFYLEVSARSLRYGLPGCNLPGQPDTTTNTPANFCHKCVAVMLGVLFEQLKDGQMCPDTEDGEDLLDIEQELAAVNGVSLPSRWDK